MSRMDCGEILSWFGGILANYCTRKIPRHPRRREVQFKLRPVVSLQRYPLVHRKKGPLQDGTEVLRCSLLMAGYKYEDFWHIEGLPTVGVIAFHAPCFSRLGSS